MTEPPTFQVDLDHIRKHYDRLSFLYRFLWGEHLHHGYWDNDQSAEEAQVRLMEVLAERAGIVRGSHVLDIGCGVGGSAFWLANQFDCHVTGLTISPVQAKMAARTAKARGLSDRVQFQIADANQWQPVPESVDMVWIMESSEHFEDKEAFFKRCASVLKPGGVLAVCAWLRRDGPMREEERGLVATIAEAMLSASLGNLSDYQRWMRESGLVVVTAEDITTRIAPTWTHCSRIAERLAVRCFIPFADAGTRRFV
jgi:tocopherol O-methyltransferase